MQFRVPLITTLPPADATRQGEMWRVRGTPDTVWICGRNNGGTYGWKSIAPVSGQTGVLNVEYEGVSTTNTPAQNTTALNAITSAIAAGTETRRNILIPDQYDIAGAWTVDLGQVNIFGLHRESCGLRQTTANVPVMQWLTEGTGDRHSINVSRLGLTHSTAPTASTTQQYGIQFRATADGTLGAGYGYYYSLFDTLKFEYCYIDIGQYTATGGICPIWSSTFRRGRSRDCYLGSVRLVSAGNSGQPALTIDRWQAYNPGIVPGGPAIEIKAGGGARLLSPNIEDWHNNGIFIHGGGTAIIDAPRFERHTLSAANTGAVRLESDSFTVRQMDFHASTISGTVSAIFELSAAHLTLDGIGIVSDSTTGTCQLIKGVFPNSSVIQNRVDLGTSGVNEYMVSGWGEGGVYTRLSVDGGVPDVDVLPTASADFRGRMMRVEGGATVADSTSICEKNATDAYVWRAI